MFLHQDTLSTKPIRSPWFIKASHSRAIRRNKLYEPTTTKVYDNLMVASLVIVIVSMITATVLIFEDFVAYSMVAFTPAACWFVYLASRRVRRNRICENRRRYIVERDDYSYKQLFECNDLAMTDAELKANPSIKGLIDRYFTGTHDADLAIHEERHDQAILKEMVERTASSIHRQCQQLLTDYRSTQTKQALDAMMKD